VDIVLGVPDGAPVVLHNNGDDTWKVTHPFKGIIGLRDFVSADLDGNGTCDFALIDGTGRLHTRIRLISGEMEDLTLPPDLGTFAALALSDGICELNLGLMALRTDGVICRIMCVGLQEQHSLATSTVVGSTGRLISPSKRNGRSWRIDEIARWHNPPLELVNGSARLFAADLDNNGAVDIVASSAGSADVWLCDAIGRYLPAAAPVVGAVQAIELTNPSGRLDLLGYSTDASPVRFVNRGARQYHWHDVRLQTSNSEIWDHNIIEMARNKNEDYSMDFERRVTPFGTGATLETRAGSYRRAQAVTSPLTHIGLGRHRWPDSIRVVWPNGDVLYRGRRSDDPDRLKLIKRDLRG